jgi:hypothetical protein
VLSVKIKVDEPFGELVEEWLKGKSKQTPGEEPAVQAQRESSKANREKRLAALCALLDVDPRGVDKLYYQLFHRTCAAGVYPTVSLADARQARDEAKQLLLKGVDPLQAKKEKQDERPANTFRILAEDGPTRPFRRPNGFSTSPIRSWVTMRSTKLILPWCSRSFAKSKLADAMKRPVADDRP